MLSGQIADGQISASSHAERDWVAENARLLTGRAGWTGQQTRQPFKNEWLQVDLGQEKVLTGLVVQGGRHRDKNVFMKRFRVGHSLDGANWTMVKEDNGTKPKVRKCVCVCVCVCGCVCGCVCVCLVLWGPNVITSIVKQFVGSPVS